MNPSLPQLASTAIGFLRGRRGIALLMVAIACFVVALGLSDGSVEVAMGVLLIVLLIFAGLVPLIALDARRISVWSDRNAKVAAAAEASARHLALLDAVIGGATRSLMDPTTLPWPINDGSRPVLLLPGAAYHLAELIPLAEELESRGIPSRIAVGDPHWDRVRQGLVGEAIDVYALPSPEIAARDTSAVLTMKDWAGYRPYVEIAKQAGLPTFAKVEGAQDFEEVDSSNDFRPYRTAEHILCQGANDFKALSGSRFIVGSTRLERLMQAPLRVSRSRLAVINLNFSYGVLTEARDLFLQSAITGCQSAGIPYVVAIHPALKSSTVNSTFTTIPISRLLENASILVSRFSTVPFEAMSRGTPFIYHNPHREQNPTFKSPNGAFSITETWSELSTAIQKAEAWHNDYRDRSRNFFSAQIDTSDDRSSEERSADIIESLVDL